MAIRSRSRGSKRPQIFLDTEMQVKNVGNGVKKTRPLNNATQRGEYTNSPTTVYGEGSRSRGFICEQHFRGVSDDDYHHVSLKMPKCRSSSNSRSSIGNSTSSINGKSRSIDLVVSQLYNISTNPSVDSPALQKPREMAVDQLQQNRATSTSIGDVELQQSSFSSDLDLIKEYAEWLRETETLLSSRVARKKQQAARKSRTQQHHGMIRRSQTARTS